LKLFDLIQATLSIFVERIPVEPHKIFGEPKLMAFDSQLFNYYKRKYRNRISLQTFKYGTFEKLLCAYLLTTGSKSCDLPLRCLIFVKHYFYRHSFIDCKIKSYFWPSFSLKKHKLLILC